MDEMNHETLIKSYLSDRFQLVYANTPHTSKVSCGVPQRSVLGPTHFISYTIPISRVRHNRLPADARA